MLGKIKFRAWNKVGKFMLEWEDFIQYELDQMAIVGNDYRIFNDSEFILMQYTGLKDKNGVEIYEGDILTLINPFTGEIAHGYTYVVFSFEYIGGWVLTSNGKDTLTIGTRTDHIEVIGNIYQNPELLEEL
ncbi:MAG: YopX family protein [Candidatus Kapabacteria bacterium]|nr:YopX family protein [Candidatus Kapabacteria bacterium]